MALSENMSVSQSPPSSPLASHALTRPHKDNLCLLNLGLASHKGVFFPTQGDLACFTSNIIFYRSNHHHWNSLWEHLKQLLLGIFLCLLRQWVPFTPPNWQVRPLPETPRWTLFQISEIFRFLKPLLRSQDLVVLPNIWSAGNTWASEWPPWTWALPRAANPPPSSAQPHLNKIQGMLFVEPTLTHTFSLNLSSVRYLLIVAWLYTIVVA